MSTMTHSLSLSSVEGGALLKKGSIPVKEQAKNEAYERAMQQARGPRSCCHNLLQSSPVTSRTACAEGNDAGGCPPVSRPGGAMLDEECRLNC
jgi:hypothetical protein